MGKKHKNKYKSYKYFLEDIDMPLEKTSLKLVLKVGGAPSTPEVVIDSLTDDNFSDTDRKQRHKKKKRHHDKHSSSSHRHHERKDFRKLEADTEDGEDSEEEMEPVPKRLHLDEDEDDDHLHVRSLREKKSNEDDKTPLQLCLHYLHKILQRKDSNGFFAFPVTDNIAPGYSSIISHPMDFSTMKGKIEDGLYSSVAEFRGDYDLMMNNCMMYNHPDTVYHKEAKRLLSVGLRHMSREKLIHMKRGLPFMAGVTNQELGLDEDSSMAANMSDDTGGGTGGGFDGSRSMKTIKVTQVKKSSLGRFEAIADDLTAEEILDQAQSVAQDAVNRLMMQSPDSKIGFLRRKEDGSTTLNILNPDESGFVSEKERVVSLGSLIGKLTTGTGALASTKEDKRNKVSPVIYLNYGAFSSYAPIYDSSSTNIGKDDSDLLLSTYADETGVQYAKSLRHFVTDAGDYTISMVDDLLNVLTSGEHSKVMAMLEQEEKEKQEQEVKITQQETDDAGAVLDQQSATSSNQTKNNLDDIGIEMSFLNNFDSGTEQLEDGNLETQKKLDSAAELIMDLQRTQYERLSEKLPEHLAYVRDPSTEEIELANKVTRKLTELVKHVTPGDVVKAESVRAAMGIALLPSNDDPGDSAHAASSSGSSSSSSWQASPGMKSGDIDIGRNARTDEMSELDDDLLDLFQQGTSAEDNDLAGNQPDVLAEDQMEDGAL